MLSWRTAVIAGVVMLALALIMPSLRVYFEQQQQLQQLRADAATAQAEVDDLNGEVARWDDPSFLVAQARERLAYVFPGETPYRVVDPETVATDDAGQAEAAEDSTDVTGNTWYDTLWGSILVAGNGTDAADDAQAPPGSAVPEASPSPQVAQDGDQSTADTAETDDAGGTADTSDANVDFSE